MALEATNNPSIFSFLSKELSSAFGIAFYCVAAVHISYICDGVV
jgi:hypothetical protein